MSDRGQCTARRVAASRLQWVYTVAEGSIDDARHDDDDTADRRADAPGRNRGLTPPARRTGRMPDPDLELREGETELGRPPQVPVDLRPLSEGGLASSSGCWTRSRPRRTSPRPNCCIASDPSGLGWLGLVRFAAGVRRS